MPVTTRSQAMDDQSSLELTLQIAANFCERLRSTWERIRSQWTCPICYRSKPATGVTVKECCQQLVCKKCSDRALKHVCMLCRHPCETYFHDTLAYPFLLTCKHETAPEHFLRRLKAYAHAIWRTGLLTTLYETRQDFIRDIVRNAHTQTRRSDTGIASLRIVGV